LAQNGPRTNENRPPYVGRPFARKRQSGTFPWVPDYRWRAIKVAASGTTALVADELFALLPLTLLLPLLGVLGALQAAISPATIQFRVLDRSSAVVARHRLSPSKSIQPAGWGEGTTGIFK